MMRFAEFLVLLTACLFLGGALQDVPGRWSLLLTGIVLLVLYHIGREPV